MSQSYLLLSVVDKEFLVIAITNPDSVSNEAERICEILRNGEADIVHIRKPEWSLDQTKELLNKIPSELHPRLKLHDHFQLLSEYNLAGVHLNSRNPDAPVEARSVSRSFHEIEQLPLSKHYDYVTLSPIYDSISKSGYKGRFNLCELKPLLAGKRVIALGGVTPEKFSELKDLGFSGAAMLGYFW